LTYHFAERFANVRT